MSVVGRLMAWDRLGPFVLAEQLGRGGMGTVWLAFEDIGFGRHRMVALKVSHRDEPEGKSRFVNESVIHSQLRHENVAQVLRAGEENGYRYIAMELLDGVDLRDVLKAAGGPLDPALAAHIMRCAAAGLHHAHTAKDPSGQPLNVVHRDVSPSNVMINFDGHVKVIDFGIATYEDRVELTDGLLIGKWRYMSPEQLRRAPLDARSDVWALGVVLWELLAGRQLFVGESKAVIARHILGAPIPAPIPGRHPLNQVVAKALARDPPERFPSAAAMQAALTGSIAEIASSHEASTLDDRLQAFVQLHFADAIERVERRNREASRNLATRAVPLPGSAAVDGTAHPMVEATATSGTGWALPAGTETKRRPMLVASIVSGVLAAVLVVVVAVSWPPAGAPAELPVPIPVADGGLAPVDAEPADDAALDADTPADARPDSGRRDGGGRPPPPRDAGLRDAGLRDAGCEGVIFPP